MLEVGPSTLSCSATSGARARGRPRELVEHERDRRGRGVVTGEEQRHHLVADLAVAERGALLVVSVEQQAEHVHSAFPARPTASDFRVDQPVELASRGEHAVHGVRGPRRMRTSGLAGVVAERLREERRGVDPTRLLAVRVEAEDRPHRDAQREPAGPRVEIELRRRRSTARAPARPPPRSSRPIASSCSRWNAGSMICRERRWNSPSIVSRPSPSSADELDEVAFAPDEVAGVRDEHVVVRLRPDHEDHG